MGFGSIYGQERAVGVLRSILASERIAAAYLFSGPSGVGKRLAAMQFVKALNCLKSGTDACDECTNCRLIDQDRFPDLFVAATRERKIIKGNPVSDRGQGFLCEIVPRLHFSPIQGKRKVVILDPADRMTDEAASMLLKTMEEPPPSTVFILLATVESAMFSTIVSRCQRIRFTPLTTESIARYLVERRQVDPALAEAASQAALGSIENATSLLESHMLEQKLQVVDMLLGFVDMPLPERVEGSGRFLTTGKRNEDREAAQRTYSIGVLLARELLLCACGLEDRARIFPERSKAMSKFARRVGVPGILKFSRAIGELGYGLSHYENPKLLLTYVGNELASLAKPTQGRAV